MEPRRLISHIQNGFVLAVHENADGTEFIRKTFCRFALNAGIHGWLWEAESELNGDLANLTTQLDYRPVLQFSNSCRHEMKVRLTASHSSTERQLHVCLFG
jgi:hypothetical protein